MGIPNSDDLAEADKTRWESSSCMPGGIRVRRLTLVLLGEPKSEGEAVRSTQQSEMRRCRIRFSEVAKRLVWPDYLL
jgi:hypothetical protein